MLQMPGYMQTPAHQVDTTISGPLRYSFSDLCFDLVMLCISAGRASFLEGRPGALAVHAALLEAAGRQQEAGAAVQVGNQLVGQSWQPTRMYVVILCYLLQVAIGTRTGGSMPYTAKLPCYRPLLVTLWIVTST